MVIDLADCGGAATIQLGFAGCGAIYSMTRSVSMFEFGTSEHCSACHAHQTVRVGTSNNLFPPSMPSDVVRWACATCGHEQTLAVRMMGHIGPHSARPIVASIPA
jgi:hypothetical protein